MKAHQIIKISIINALALLMYGNVYGELNPVSNLETLPPNLSKESAITRNKELDDYKTLHSLVANKKTPITWVLAGDSITQGNFHTRGARCYPELWAELVRSELGRTNDLVINTGVSGEITTGLLNQFKWRVARFEPQIVSINLGVNDSDTSKLGMDKIDIYKTNLEKLVDEVRSLHALPILHITSPTFEQNDRAKVLEAFWAVIYRVATDKNVLLVDHGSHWKQFAWDDKVRKSWFNNPFHPNGKGHAEMYKKMAFDLGLFSPGRPSSKLGDQTL